MKKFGLLIFSAALILGLVVSNVFSFLSVKDKFTNFSFRIGGEKGSGNFVKEARDLKGFKSIDVGGVFQVEITAQRDFGVEIEADDNLLPLIKTHVSGSTLHIEADKKLSSSQPIRIRISAPDITDLEISGAANVTLNELKNAGVSVEASGASKIKLAGETGRVTIDVSGATSVDADSLKAENGSVEASGASHVDVNVTGNLRADASGASKIIYAGTPSTLEKKSSGASKVSQK
ncbi:MAG: head GIN domain-containing protein [Pyrinomonadaceae bacterium]